MGEHWSFYVWLAVFCIAFSLITVGLVFHTINANMIGPIG